MRTRSMRKVLFVIVCVGLLFGSLGSASCGADRKDTLIVATRADTNALDPIITGSATGANLFLQIYDYLFYQNPDGSISPRLVERWEQPDDKTYIFHLKHGVKFHNGEPFTAEDAMFTINRGRTSVTATGSNILLAMIEDVKKIDDYTISVHLKNPFTPFLYVFSEVWGGVVCKKVVEEIGTEAHNRAPIGTGPFKFVKWIKGDRVILERNDDYHGEKPQFSSLIIRAVPEDSVRVIELESGAVDVAYDVSVNDFKRVEENPKLTLLKRKSLRTDFVVFNCSKPPLDNVKVRHAIAKALDLEGMRQAIYRSEGYVPGGPIPYDMRYSDQSLKAPAQDIEGAKKLLEEAGVKDLTLTLMTSESKERVDAATIIQAQLEEIGVKADIQVMEYGAFLDKVDRGEHDLALGGWGNNLPDPEFALTRLYHSRAINVTNNAFFSNKEFDALLDKGVTVPEGPEREAVYKEAQRLFLDQMPTLYWAVRGIAAAYGPRVQEFPMHIRGIYEFSKVKLNQE